MAATGLPVPPVYELVEAHGRAGIVCGLVDGRTMLQHIISRPWRTLPLAKQLAELHAGIHQHTVAGLPGCKETPERRIPGLPGIAEELRQSCSTA